MNRQTVLDVCNSLNVVEQQGGEECYILVENNEENRKRLKDVGVPLDTIDKYGDEDTFCILALTFNEGYADEFKNGELIWGKINDDLIYRVLNGEGTAIDAERLLRELEPKLLGKGRGDIEWTA